MHLSNTHSCFAANFSRAGTRGVRLPGIGWRWRLAVMAMALTGIPAHAANRVVRIEAPAAAPAGSTIHVSVQASTDAAGEKIGFLHAEYSPDGGATWRPIAYAADGAAREERGITFQTGAAGSTILVRVRIAFRGGEAGDVDAAGKAIDWDGSWAKWAVPPARIARIRIVAG